MDIQQDYIQMPSISAISSHVEEQNPKDNDCCFHFWCWFLQIVVWCVFIASIILVCFDNSAYIITFPIYVFFHLIYICIEGCSSIGLFLPNYGQIKEVKEALRNYYATPPIIEFYGRSYHIVVDRGEDSNGNTVETETEYTTHEEHYKMPYYTERDISGPFHLNCQNEDLKKNALLNYK